MKVLLISYGIKEYDGRLMELRDIANRLGTVTTVCVSESKTMNSDEKLLEIESFKYLSIRNYFSFIKLSLKTAKELSDIDILISDNFFSAIPSLLIKLIYKPKKIVQDVRELYFYKDMRKKSEKLLCYFESKMIKKSDVILCANKYRSKIMYDYYKLDNYPIVFENIRFLSGEFDKNDLDEKYKDTFTSDINIISTGGLSIKRNTDKLVKAMKKFPANYMLFLVGGGTKEDKNIISEIIKNDEISNVKFISKVPLHELRYIVKKCDIGIVNYHRNDLNNMYCASGKVYEYLELGLPFVCTENEPLKDFCEQYNVGIADDEFSNGIKNLADNLKVYRENVIKFMENVSVEKYNSNVALEIRNMLDEGE